MLLSYLNPFIVRVCCVVAFLKRCSKFHLSASLPYFLTYFLTYNFFIGCGRNPLLSLWPMEANFSMVGVLGIFSHWVFRLGISVEFWLFFAVFVEALNFFVCGLWNGGIISSLIFETGPSNRRQLFADNLLVVQLSLYPSFILPLSPRLISKFIILYFFPSLWRPWINQPLLLLLALLSASAIKIRNVYRRFSVAFGFLSHFVIYIYLQVNFKSDCYLVMQWPIQTPFISISITTVRHIFYVMNRSTRI